MLTLGISYARAADTRVPDAVASEFSLNFTQVSNVQWENFDNYFKVSFNHHGIFLYAFYTADGELMGVASNVTADKLPENLLSRVKSKYSGYWITELSRFSINNKTGYSITLENADKKIILKTYDHQQWQLYRTINKS